MSFDYPVLLALHEVPVLVVGGGPVAARKAAGLAAAGARVTLVAPEVCADAEAAAAVVVRREYRPQDLDGQRLVMVATDDPEVNAAVAAAATAAGVWVNSADDPANCTFILPAVVRRGPVVAAVSTGGTSPALAQALRDEIAALVLRPGVEAAAADLGQQRLELQTAGVSTESVAWADRVAASLADHRAGPGGLGA